MPTVTRLFHQYCLSFCALAALAATPALAAFGSFSIPINAVFLSGGAVSTTSINLPNGANSSFFFNFVLPRDYATDEEVRVVIYMMAQNFTQPCAVRFVPVQLNKFRTGEPYVNNIGGLSSGSATVSFGADNAIVGKVITLNPGGPLAGQQRGDAFELEFRREPGSPADTCSGNLFIRAIDIRYPLAP